MTRKSSRRAHRRQPGGNGGHRNAGGTKRRLDISGGQFWSGLTLLIAVAGLAFAGMSYFQDRDGRTAATGQRVRLVSVRPDIKENIPLSIQEVEGGPVSTGAADGPALDIVLHNDFEQTALIDRIDLTVVDAAELSSCQGAGALPASMEYTFRIPTQGAIVGRTFSVRELFTIAGKEPDRLLISVGPDSIPDQHWGWIYTVRATLHLQTGQELVTEAVTLAGAGTAAAAESIKTTAPIANQVYLNLDCVRPHRDVIRSFARRPEPHSATLDDALRILDQLDL